MELLGTNKDPFIARRKFWQSHILLGTISVFLHKAYQSWQYSDNKLVLVCLEEEYA